MDPIWYTIRIVATVVMSGIGALLLWAAYEVSGNVSGAALAWMIVLALALPVGFSFMFTVVGWHRSAASAPNAVIAWCGDLRRYPFLWVGFVGFLFGGAYQIMDEIRRGDSERAALQAFQRDVRDKLGDACYARAYQAIGAGSGDIGMNLRVPHFCTCLDSEVEKSYSPEEFAPVAKERWWQSGDGDAKIGRIIHKCRLYDSSVVRAVRTIRESGGDPGDTAMNAKLLDYAACADLEMTTGYDTAELMKISADPAQQDADAKFRPIVAKCLKYADW
jgi:hypothetical protein